LAQAIVMPHSNLEGLSARKIRMHDNYGINLLALSRRDETTKARLHTVRFQIGDVLLLQGESKSLERALAKLGCLLLTDNPLSKPPAMTTTLVATGMFLVAIGAASLGLVSVPIALVTLAIGLVLSGVISLQEAYDSVEWPIIALLAALIPIGMAMKTTGAAGAMAGFLVASAEGWPIWAMIALVLVVSMWLSDLVHNTPAAVLMAPIAANIAQSLGQPLDPFLMAVAVGSASPYLTPIGHQSNTLVMQPGGYRFTDYTRVGVPLQIIIVAVGVPMIMAVWG